MSTPLEITDPRFVPKANPNAFDRLALRMFRDERDRPFAYVICGILGLQVPLGLALFVPGVFRWWLGGIYLAVLFGLFFDRFILMLHNTSHRPLFVKKFKRLNGLIPWFISPFMGQSPQTYFAHHVGMHHPENNLPDDLSSTMKFQRDSFAHFMQYWATFFFFGIRDMVVYLKTHNRKRLIWRMVVGETSFYIILAIAFAIEWRAAVVVFALPFFLARFLMMAGNWGQHAFIDAEQPENPYRNSITCINAKYNQRCFNDGYHIGHHVKATRHWTDMPADFEDNRDRYISEGSVVFHGVDYFVIWIMLMLKRYDALADRVVDLGDSGRTREETIAMLREKLRPIPAEPAPAQS